MVVRMAVHANAPVIIKRKKVIAGGGHHGGAWKVAYADFVTAMMAFFLLMWLLNATTEQQRKGIADYFSPTVPIARISGGGDGMFGGTDMFSRDTMAQSGTGGVGQLDGSVASDDSAAAQERAAEVAALRDLEETLLGQGGEAMVSDQALRHVVTRLTDEGLVIEIFSLDGAPIFVGDSQTPTPVLHELAAMLARVFAMVENPVAVTGHNRGQTVVLVDNPVWEVSAGRADQMRQLMEAGGLDPARLRRVTGAADRVLADDNPMSIRNDRVEVTLLRTKT